MSCRPAVVVALACLPWAGCSFVVDGVGPLPPHGGAEGGTVVDLASLSGEGDASLDLALAAVDEAIAPPDLAVAAADLAVAPVPDLAAPDQGDPCTPPTGKPPKGALVAQCVQGSPPTIDGSLLDWNVFGFTLVNHDDSAKCDFPGTWSNLGALVNDPDCSASFGLRWDLQYLYVAILVSDDIRGVTGISDPTGGAYWKDDTTEIYVDGKNARPDKYTALIRQIMVTADGRGQEYQDGLPGSPRALESGIVYKVGPSLFQGWTLEMAIPWSLLGASPASGNLVGFDLQIDDDDHAGGGTRDREVLWWNAQAKVAGCDYPWCSPADFGVVQLGGR